MHSIRILNGSLTDVVQGTLTTDVVGTNDANEIIKKGNIATIKFRINDATFSGWNTVVANVPPAFRPSQTIFMMGYGILTNDVHIPIPYEIQPNGNIFQRYTSGSIKQIGIYGTYLIV